MKHLLPALFLGFILLVVPFASEAAGLVPCGNVAGGEQPCQSCDVVKLTNNVISWLVMILSIIAALIIVYAGAKLVTAGGNTHAMEEAKSTMTNIIIGFIIVLSGWLVVDYGMKALVNDRTFGVWNEVQCTQQPVATTTAQTTINYTPAFALIGNVQGWVPGSAAGATVAACALLPGPPGVREYNCSPQQTQCTNIGGLAAISADGSTVACSPGQSSSGGGGGIKPPDLSAGGACATNLVQPYFGAQTGNAQCIIRGESTCGASMVSVTDKMSIDGRAFSFGPMQINLTVHEIIGCAGYPPVMDCKTAFSGRNYSARVINEGLYQQCARAVQNIDCGLKNGARIQRRDGWYPTWSTAAGCGLR